MDSVHLAYSQVEFRVTVGTAPLERIVQFAEVYVTGFVWTFESLSVEGFSNAVGVGAAVDRLLVFFYMLG